MGAVKILKWWTVPFFGDDGDGAQIHFLVAKFMRGGRRG